MLSIITKIKEKIDDRKPVNIFGPSIFETFEGRTAIKDRFVDMVKLQDRKEGVHRDPLFIESIAMLDRLRETHYFEKYITKSPFGPMLDIDYINPTEEDGMFVHKAVSKILDNLSKVIYSVSYELSRDKHAWIAYGYELSYTNEHNHSVLVIPYQGMAGQKICRMVIQCPDKLR